jgi:hypothetical protein
VQIVGGDATSYHVQTGGAVYSLPRAKVLASIALAPAVIQTAPAPAVPPGPPPAPPSAESTEPSGYSRRKAGIAYFAMSWGLTAVIASARSDNDPDARLGFIPILGPLGWTLANDEDDFGEDGWDWLAIFDSAIQAGGIYWMVVGGRFGGRDKPVVVSPISRRSFHGVAISGSF